MTRFLAYIGWNEEVDSQPDADRERDESDHRKHDDFVWILGFGSFLLGFGICASFVAWADIRRRHAR